MEALKQYDHDMKEARAARDFDMERARQRYETDVRHAENRYSLTVERIADTLARAVREYQWESKPDPTPRHCSAPEPDVDNAPPLSVPRDFLAPYLRPESEQPDPEWVPPSGDMTCDYRPVYRVTRVHEPVDGAEDPKPVEVANPEPVETTAAPLTVADTPDPVADMSPADDDGDDDDGDGDDDDGDGDGTPFHIPAPDDREALKTAIAALEQRPDTDPTAARTADCRLVVRGGPPA